MSARRLFALDVGTRKVAGLLVERGDEGARILHWAAREHPGRAMLDGQVHLIAPAAKVIAEVKAEMERLCGEAIQEAHVAVAGRALILQAKEVTLKTGHREALSREQVLAMELQAVKEARGALSDPRALGGAYCVGYTVQERRLDGVPMLALEGHQGDEVGLKVLATFLPKLALDSLCSALRLAGLSPASLTLEPIAAADLAVPQDLRRLNLAFVDVGAGTSDIALTRDGRVEAIAMVPVAGDEVTERLSAAFLLDFGEAERLKREAGQSGDVEVRDVFGARRRLSTADVWKEMGVALDHWAREVSVKILSLNGGQPPQGVLLAGGGSMALGADLALASLLKLPGGRVGRRPASLQRAFSSLPEGLDQPWAITPLGIAAAALAKQGLPFAAFRVNEAWVHVLNLDQRFTAFDALVATGRDLAQFYGRPGLAVTYRFNGEARSERGTLGSAARLFVNGVQAPLDAPLSAGDALTFYDAQPGADGRLSLREALAREGLHEGQVLLNGERRRLPMKVSVGGQEAADLDRPLQDRDEVRAASGAVLKELLAREGFDLGGLIARDIAVTVNGEPKVLAQRNYRLRVNGREAGLDQALKDGDEVDFEPGGSFQERVRDLLGLAAGKPLRVKLNGEWAVLERAGRVLMNGREVSPEEFLIDGAAIQVEAEPRSAPTVAEALERFGLSAWLSAGALKVTLNGRDAALDEPLENGAELDLSLDDRTRRAGH